MQELGFNVGVAAGWFPQVPQGSYALVQLPPNVAADLAAVIAAAVRRCYIPDQLVQQRVLATGLNPVDIVASKLPDPGATMAGDFGEILIYFYFCTLHPNQAFGPKKWRLKEARTKPAPYSDVIHFILPNWPQPSAADALICSEVKLKSTPSEFNPIEKAIIGCEKDRVNRLAKTLVWLKERATLEDLGQVQIAHIDRFLHSAGLPSTTKSFNAVAVVCSSMVNAEVANAPAQPSPHYTLTVIAVPNLHQTYNQVFAAARQWP